MFTFRRKPQKKADDEGAPVIRNSPSLPELSAQGIPWPGNLVDVQALKQEGPEPPHAARTSFAPGAPGHVEFHKPWTAPGKAVGGESPAAPISSMYMSHPPPAFETRKIPPSARHRAVSRRTRNPTTFNLMVAGAQGVGKTSLLRLLLNTADISPTATADQKTAVERFLRGAPKRTDAIQTACIEICESKYDRLLLSVIDTPGLDFQEGHELRLERQVSTVVKYLDAQFADTLSEESKVVRQSKGDQHIHLCIYMIDPSSIVTTAVRRAQSVFPSKVRSETTISYPPPTPPLDENASDDEDDESGVGLTMSPVDIRVIRRLASRANVLPVIARADSLTDDTLASLKKVIRRDLDAADLDFGVFGPAGMDPDLMKSPVEPNSRRARAITHGSTDTSEDQSGEEGAEEEPVRASRPVIKLRPGRLARTRSSRSRTRVDLAEMANEPTAFEVNDAESVASVRFSAHIVTKTDLSERMPFALIQPEYAPRKRRTSSVKSPAANGNGSVINGNGSVAGDDHSDHAFPTPSEDGHAHSSVTSPSSPTGPPSVRNFAYLNGPPADLRGVFVRKYRWGTIDVLAPEHCDFAALRTAVLSTHMKMLKIRTKEVLYEKYRTEKLLARRATRNISDEETRRLLEDLGL